ncbi:MAG TPA: tyrosine-type recombinase/integrase [Pyrinomonadaceae bacterium]|nr:tyrosine-type recombinase/integrase [Pyrinomonadaceae bacterium]
MLLHKCQYESSTLYTLLDSQDRVAVHPTLYMRYLLKRARPVESQRQIAYVVKLHCQWVEESSRLRDSSVDEAVACIDGDDILDWINDQRKTGVSEATVNNRELLVREMYRWFTTASGGRVRTDLPWCDKPYSKTPHSRLPRFVTKEQVIRLLKGMHNESQRVAAHFMYDTGVRVSELVRLTNRYLPQESDWPEEVNYYPLLVPGSKPYDGRKYKYRYTIISRPVLARVRRYHATPEYIMAKAADMPGPDKPVFLNVHGGPLTKDSVQKGIRDAWLRQGGRFREVSPHRLRHGAAFSILQSEFGKELLDSMLILKGVLGHSQLSTTEIYSAIPVTALQSVAGRREVRLKYREAQDIYDATYLPRYMNTERRGRWRR